MNFSWLDLFRALTFETALVIGCAFGISAVIRSGFWRRSIWQACILALGLLVVCESTGVARALVAWLTVTREIEASEAPQPRQAPVNVIERHAQGIWLNEEPTLGSASPATSVRQTWWPGIAWVTGFVLIGTRLGFAMLLFGRFRKQRRLLRNSELIERLRDLAVRLRVLRAVRLSVSETLLTPVAFGIFRPSICVPEDFTRRFNPAQQSAMLAHEMAHIAGHDAVWYWLDDLVTALLWWHPLVWFVRRQFHASSEAAADEASLAIENGPDLLAECLVRLGARLQRPADSVLLSISGFRSDLGRRVERLICLQKKAWRPVSRFRVALVKISSLLALTAAALACVAWIDPAAPGTDLKSAWQDSLARVALTAVGETIEDFKLADALPDALSLPAAKTKSTSRKPVFLANAQAAPIEKPRAPNPIAGPRGQSTVAINAVSKFADEPLKNSVQKDGTALSRSEPEPLLTRVFKVEPTALGASLEKWARANGKSTLAEDTQDDEHQRVFHYLRAFFASAGVEFPTYGTQIGTSDGNLGKMLIEKKAFDLDEAMIDATPPRKMFFFTGRTGLIFVGATSEELDRVDKALRDLDAVRRRVKINVQYVQLFESESKQFALDLALTNVANMKWGKPSYNVDMPASRQAMSWAANHGGIGGGGGMSGSIPWTMILAESQVRGLRRAFVQRSKGEFLSAEAMASNGRQLKIDMTQQKLAANSAAKVPGLSTGAPLNVIPLVVNDGQSIELTVLTHFNDAQTYDDPGPFKEPGPLESRDLFDPPRPVPTIVPLPRSRPRMISASAVTSAGETLVLNVPVPERRFASGSSTNAALREELFIFITASVMDPVER